MKTPIKLFSFCGLALMLSATSCNDFRNELTFHKHMISRGSWQWVITHEKDSFLGKNIPDSLYADGKKSVLRYKFTGKMDTLYQVGPVDFPVFFKTLPQIELIP